MNLPLKSHMEQGDPEEGMVDIDYIVPTIENKDSAAVEFEEEAGHEFLEQCFNSRYQIGDPGWCKYLASIALRYQESINDRAKEIAIDEFLDKIPS